MDLPDLPLVVLDTETTGFIPKVNRVIEYAHKVVRGAEVVEEYEQLISIDSDVPEVVQVLTRIRPEALEGKPTFDDVREEIVKRIGDDTIVVGQNVGFDIRMLRGEGIDLSDRPWIDTSMLASLVFPELASYSLGYISTVLELHHTPVHRALGDVHATLELLERCWQRLLELPQDRVLEIKTIMSKSSPGYKALFDALPTSDKKADPAWMTMQPPKTFQSAARTVELQKPDVGVVDIIEEPLERDFLQGILDAAIADTDTVHFIAVKNLTATSKRLKLSEQVRILQPPFLLLDQQAADTLKKKEPFTADEATLVTKLHWYEPTSQYEAPVHGDEKSIWSGTLACTEESDTYKAQFQDLPSVVLMDHRQLLSFAADPAKAHGALTDDVHIIIDDTSMLEDTATKAYGYYCDIDSLRAATEGDAEASKIANLLALWIEKTRQAQDVYHLTKMDLDSPEVNALREQIAQQLESELPSQLKHILTAVQHCLEEEALARVTWIETRQDGSQYLHSIPESVAELLHDRLFSRHRVSVIVPPESHKQMQEIIHRQTETALNHVVDRSQRTVNVSFANDVSTESILSDPPDGKTIVLVNSRRIIEDFFVRFTEDLEERGITLICQSLSGGMNRMQAEFLAAPSPAIWVMTPWMFEGVELPIDTVAHLAIDAVPFDHPNQPIFAKRAEHFKNGFMEYSLPRLQFRLFRLLRTFRRIATTDAPVEFLDKRLHEKRYGNNVMKYVRDFCGEIRPSASQSGPGDYPGNWQMNLFDG